ARAADVRIEDGDALLVDQVVVAAEEAGTRLALRPAMDVDEQWPRPGEALRVGPAEEAGDALAVEAARLDEFRLDIDGGVEPARLAPRPAGHRKAARVDGIDVGRAARRAQAEADRAPGGDLQVADRAGRQRGDEPGISGARIEQPQTA